MKINTKMFSSINYRSVIIGIIMFISILAFLFTGFGRVSIFNFRAMDPSTALIVGNQKVDMSEFSTLLTSQGYSNSMPDNQKQYLLSQVLNNLIYQKLLLEEAQKMGFTTNQAEIVSFIRSIRAFADPATNQFSLDRFKQYLSSQQTTDIEFFQRVQNELIVNNFTQLLFMPEVYPANMAKSQYLMNHTSFNLAYAVININSESIAKEAGTKVDEFVKNPDNQKALEDLYRVQKAKFIQPTQYKVRSILVSHKEASRAQGAALGRDRLAAQKLVDSVLVKVQNGSDFGTLASQINDDPRALQNKGDLGFIDDTKIDPPSYKAISALSINKPLSIVIDTPFGFRLFKLEDKKEGFSKTFEEVKQILAQELLAQKLRTTLQTEFENKIRAALTHSSGVSSLDALLAEQGISWKTNEKPFTIQDNFIDELGSAATLSENVFTLKKPGDVIPKILDFGASKHIVVKLLSMRVPNSPSETDVKELQKKTSDDDVQAFFQSYLAKLKESYETKGKIKINPVLLSSRDGEKSSRGLTEGSSPD